MRIGSLFSGAGGLDLAVEATFGGRTVWHCENDAAASKVLAARWPGVPNYNDVKAINWNLVEPAEILCGGYPCQPFSAAGRRKGITDERHLWPYFAEAIRRIRPRSVVLENVAGHRTLGLDTVLADLAASGYDAQWCSVRASDIGACHRRERLFVLATDTGRPRPPGAPTGQPHRRFEPARRDSAAVELLPTPEAKNAHAGPDYARMKRAGSGGHDLVTALAYHRVSATNWGKYEAAIRRWEALTRPAPKPTEPNTKGNPRLNAPFPEWMMGWPAGWATDLVSRDAALRIIGNGVVPQQAEVALRFLLSVCETAA